MKKTSFFDLDNLDFRVKSITFRTARVGSYQSCGARIFNELVYKLNGSSRQLFPDRTLDLVPDSVYFIPKGSKNRQIITEAGAQSGTVIATGGGCVTRAENYPLLHQNSVIVWLQRDTARLPSKGRPLSQNADLAAMYAVRAPLYARFSDYSADNNGSPEETVRHIMEVLS